MSGEAWPGEGGRAGARAFLRERAERKRQDAERRAEREGQRLQRPPPNPDHPNAFVRIGAPEHAAEALDEAGVTEPTPIQALSLPAVLSGEHCCLLAETGSGKTFAYSLPIFSEVATANFKPGRKPGICSPSVVVLVPTMELAKQTGALVRLAAEWCTPPRQRTPYGVMVVAGKEKKLLKPVERKAERDRRAGRGRGRRVKFNEKTIEYLRGFEASEAVVGTPQRILTLIEGGWLRLNRVRHVAVDEADELISPGFAEPVREVVSRARGESGRNAYGCPVQCVFAAATLDKHEWATLQGMFPFSTQRVASERLHCHHAELVQEVVEVASDAERDAALERVVRGTEAPQVVVFAATPERCDAVAASVTKMGVPAAAFHGREKNRGFMLDEFFAGELQVLVCTDVAARGIDFPRLRHVVQYDAARSLQLHVHRVGRTGRTGHGPGPFFSTVFLDEGARDDVATKVREAGAAPAGVDAVVEGL